jgi:hypothetical protein
VVDMGDDGNVAKILAAAVLCVNHPIIFESTGPMSSGAVD